MKKIAILKDYYARKNYYSKELLFMILKSIYSNLFLPRYLRIATYLTLTRLGRTSSRTKIRNRCIQTGTARGLYNYFGLNRAAIKELQKNETYRVVKKSS